MLKIRELAIANYKSFGAKLSVIDFVAEPGITVIRGENKDASDPNNRNGVGKSTIFCALCFALTGKPMKMPGKQKKLVNKINGKGLVTELLFDIVHQGVAYECKIIRKIDPSSCRFYMKPVNAEGDLESKAYDKTRDSIAETTADIIKITHIDHLVFKQIITSATKQKSLLELDASEQRKVLEMILAFTLFSDKAAAIKAERVLLEQQLTVETARHEEKMAARAKTLEQITQLEETHDRWETDKSNAITELEEEILIYADIDFETEKKNIEKANAVKQNYDAESLVLDKLQADIQSCSQQITKIDQSLSSLKGRKHALETQDATSFIQEYDTWEDAQTQLVSVSTELKEIGNLISQCHNQRTSITEEIENMSENCPTCGQDWPDIEKQEERIEQLASELEIIETDLKKHVGEEQRIQFQKSELELITKPNTSTFSNKSEAMKADGTLEEITKQIDTLTGDKQKLAEQVSELKSNTSEIEKTLSQHKSQHEVCLEQCVFSTMDELSEMRLQANSANERMLALKSSTNPHTEVLQRLKTDIPQSVDMTLIEDMQSNIDHRKYLEKRLTNKSSDFRRAVMQEWLPTLNEKIAEYMDKLDQPFTVTFNDDLSVSVESFGIEGDFAELSSGEEERVILAVNLALRHVFEGIHMPINILCIDERLDSGLCEAGAERALLLLRSLSDEHGKSIMLISHKSETLDHADRIIDVVKDKRFTSISTRGI